MRVMRYSAIFILAAGLAWFLTTAQIRVSIRPLSAWEAATSTVGLVLGLVLTRVWRVQRYVRLPWLHLLAGVALLSLFSIGLFMVSFASPLRTVAPLLMSVGLAWSMLGAAALRKM